MNYFDSVASARDLLEDRIKLKIYWAERHLQNLKDFQKAEEINSTFETRVKWEHEIECLLFFMIGAKDALLVRICQKLGLDNINEDERAHIHKINPELRAKGKEAILERLNKLSSQTHTWFWDMNQNRVKATHTSLVSILVSRNIGSGEGDGTTLKVQSNRKLEVVPYLEKCLGNMKDLIQYTIDQDPLLK